MKDSENSDRTMQERRWGSAVEVEKWTSCPIPDIVCEGDGEARAREVLAENIVLVRLIEEVDADDPVLDLAAKLDVEWPFIRAAAAASANRLKSLDSTLTPFTTEDTSIVVFGSLARRELTSGSDLDWVLLVDGSASPIHLEDSLSIESSLEEESAKRPGPEATFGGLVFSHDLINYIGGGDDTNANLTRRMLLLLESVCIGRDDAYRRVVTNVLRRYIVEDYGWMHGRNPRNVPRFLLNDMARYWRTLAVDFAYKRRRRAGRGWALRTAKLRLSRKLTYAAGLLMCFRCAILPAGTDEIPGGDIEQAALELVDHLQTDVQMTPLALFASLFIEHDQLSDAARRMFGAYDDFLAILNDDDKRKHLDELSQPELVASDPVYQRVRELGHEFQGALDAVFFDPVGCPQIYELTRTYGVF
jgi:predicted nucleotidyltransferase